MNQLLTYLRKPLRLTVFCAVLSLLNLLLYHRAFFAFVVSHTELTGLARVMLVLALVVLVLLANFFACFLLLYLGRIVGRIIVAAAHLCSAAAVYFVRFYQVLIDGTMMENVFNTRYSESSQYFTWGFALWMLLFGVLPAVYVLSRRLDYGSWKHFFVALGSSLATVAVVVLACFNQFLWIGQYDTELGGLLFPWSYTINSCRILSQERHQQQQEILLPDATAITEDRTAVVLVIGESARRDNFSLYGYVRETNPRLTQQTGLYVLPATSCATYTLRGVQAILEPYDSDDLYEVLPNYLYRQGVDVSWRTSNWGEPPVHVPEYLEPSDIEDRYYERPCDEQLMAGIKPRILQSDKSKVLIVLHTSTSHGPCYTEHYPAEYECFTPVCDNVEEARRYPDKLINAYDNTIVYTDYLLSSLIDTLRTIDDWRCAMLFVSDHGESLGENGLYMHGVPMRIAPKEQYEIPFLVWTKDDFCTPHNPQQPIDQHSVFHSVLHLMGITSPVYDAEKDIF